MNGGKERRASFAVRLFGPLAVEDGDRRLGPRDLGGARPKQVLEILLAARGRCVATDRLAGLVWPGQQPRDTVSSIHTFVSTLRRHLTKDRKLAHELVVTEAEAYRFATGEVDLDLDRFDTLVERSAREPTRLARRSLEQALAVVCGEVLEDEPYAVWAQDLRGTYQRRVLGARLDAADAALAELDYEAALAHADAAIALDEFSERAQMAAMLALYASGRQAEALQAYLRFRSLVGSEFGLEPTAQIQALQSAILRQDDVRVLLPRPVERAPRDFSGHSVRLLGRNGELRALEDAARRALSGRFALLLIEGEAGMGKTRLLEELAASLEGVRTGRARCRELEHHLPYVPLAAALRDALTSAELHARRRSGLRQIMPEIPCADPPADLSETDALEALVDVLAEHAPLALFVDDLQWADRATATAISYLQHRCAAIPVVVVAAIRSEDAPPDHFARRLTPDAIVWLQSLAPADLAVVAIPDLHRLTGGNPQFMCEIIASGSRGGIPGALAEKLLARCRSEGTASYRLLQAASTLAQPFDPEILASLLRADLAELTDELDRMCERRILRADGTRFRFCYELVREVLSATVSPARRQLLCQRDGQAGERSGLSRRD